MEASGHVDQRMADGSTSTEIEIILIVTPAKMESDMSFEIMS